MKLWSGSAASPILAVAQRSPLCVQRPPPRESICVPHQHTPCDHPAQLQCQCASSPVVQCSSSSRRRDHVPLPRSRLDIAGWCVVGPTRLIAHRRLLSARHRLAWHTHGGIPLVSRRLSVAVVCVRRLCARVVCRRDCAVSWVLRPAMPALPRHCDTLHRRRWVSAGAAREWHVREATGKGVGECVHACGRRRSSRQSRTGSHSSPRQSPAPCAAVTRTRPRTPHHAPQHPSKESGTQATAEERVRTERVAGIA